MVSWRVRTSCRRRWDFFTFLFLYIHAFSFVTSLLTPLCSKLVTVSNPFPFITITPQSSRCLVCRYEREPTTTSVENDAQQEYEIQRFRNRAALAERVLKEKMKDLKLLKGKLLVLQDVVQRLQRSHKGQRAMWENQLEQNTTQWRAKWEEEEQKRTEVEISLKYLEEDLNQTRYELEAQRRDFATSFSKLQETYDRDRKQWHREKLLQLEQEKKVQLEIAALQKEVLEMDQLLENAQSELANLQQKHKTRVYQLEQRLDEEQKKNEELKRQLDGALSEKQQIILQMEQLTASVNESLLIATSSVQAAEKREKVLEEQVETLQMQIQSLIDEQSQRENEISKEQKPNDESAAVIKQLQAEVERLDNQLRMERLTAATQRRIDQRQFEEALTRQREQYELKLRWNAMQDFRKPPNRPQQGFWNRLRSRLSKSVSGR